jgi:DHA2 family multidrug resistance protein
VNVALPSIRASIGASLQDTSWITTGYIVSNIIIIPMTGFFQRRFGYRNYFAGSLILFTLASLLCATAWSLPSIVLFRALQGLGGGALIPTASSVMLDRFPKAERGMAMAMFGLGAMTGPLLGPSVGGWLTDQFSWHMIFLINIPIGCVELVLMMSILREDRSKVERVPVDGWGIAWLIGWLSTMQYVLEEGNTEGWFESNEICIFSFISLTFFFLFIERELTTPYPVVQLRFFANRQYLMGTLVNVGVGLALFGSIYVFSLFCGVMMGYTAGQTGALIFKAALLQGFTMPLIGRFGSKIDARYLVGFGVLMLIASLAQNAMLTGQEDSWQLVVPQLTRALGMGAIIIPVSTLALDGISADDVGDATGVFSLTRELGGSVGTAGLAMLITRQTAYHQSRIAESLSTVSVEAQGRLMMMQQMLSARLGDPLRGHDLALGMMNGTVARQALLLAFDDAFAVSTVIACGMFLVVLSMKKPLVTPGGMTGGH